ncbi:hypothetical protein TWF718_007193 [Orbilia javanica]|uniref:MYND-type domain-containing protein n=1 Tax=Orbilia javanica TaxID=47235 RepID=A0AAN8RNE4_9PEZI
MAGYKPPTSRCYICPSTTNLFPCSRCSAVEYCSPSHQSQDATRHSTECNNIHESHQRFQTVHNGIKQTYNVTDEGMLPLFNRYIDGALFKHPLSIEYLTASEEYSNSLLSVEGSVAALELVYEHAVWMHCIAHDQNEPGFFVTAALLRMGRDEVCFRYLRAHEDDGAVRSMHSPAVELRRDLLGGFVNQPGIVDMLWGKIKIGEYITATSGLAAMLILFWWINDLKNIENFREVEGWLIQNLNRDVVYMIAETIPQTDFVRTKRLYENDNQKLIEKMETWMEYYFLKLAYQHAGIWQRLLEGIDNNGRFSSQFGSANLPAELCWRAWKDTPGAAEYLRGMVPKAVQWFKEKESLEQVKVAGGIRVDWEEEQMILFGEFLSTV